MVLEEATASTEPSPFCSDGYQQQPPPSSDADPYAGDRSPAVLSSRDRSYILVAPGVYVNTANLPKPFNFPGFPKFPEGKHTTSLENTMQKMCKEQADALGRPIRQEEADALAYHFSKGVRIASFGPDVGMAASVFLAWRGSDKMRFPGWTPDPEKFKYDKFAFIRGWPARAMWQTVRLATYSVPCMFFATVFMGTYASTVGAVGQTTDPRLKDWNEGMRERARQKRGELSRKVDETPGQREGETFEMARQRRNIQRSQQDFRGKKNDVDDMSPAGGSFGDEFVEGSSNDSGLMSDSQTNMAQQQSGRQAQASQQAPSRQFGDNNASPTAQPDSSSKQSSGSAWDRLRQQAVSGQGQAASQSPKGSSVPEGSSSLDSFAFSNAEEERQLARSEAQKQFDARIERERTGKDFDEGGNKGWRR